MMDSELHIQLLLPWAMFATSTALVFLSGGWLVRTLIRGEGYYKRMGYPNVTKRLRRVRVYLQLNTATSQLTQVVLVMLLAPLVWVAFAFTLPWWLTPE